MRRFNGLCVMAVLLLPGCSDTDAGHADSSVVPASGAVAIAETGDTITVWKDANCGCCKNWVEHMRKHGFTVIAHDTPDLTPVKQTRGVGADLASCHTALIAGYTIEGHVPADVVRKMLAEKPAITGLAVPGMPMGSPGMEGGTPDKYDVIAFKTDGSRSVYASR